MNNLIKKFAVASILIISPILWWSNSQVSAKSKQIQSESINCDNVTNPEKLQSCSSLYAQAGRPKDKWVRLTEKEEINQIKSLIDSRMGVAALNQLALEGFIGFDCKRSFYRNEPYGYFQTLMRVKCNKPRGASAAIGYKEIRVIFNRFESNIEDFKIERVSEETGPPKIKLPD